MADVQRTSLVRHVRSLAGLPADGAAPDGQLLRKVAAQRDERAFEILVHRHAPLVWRVCRRALGHAQDAEDAAQATFLVLARNAGSIRAPQSLAGWLYGVASRIARRAKAQSGRRRAREEKAVPRPVPDPFQEAAWREWGRIVDEEVQALPEKYRLPLLLCCWQDKTHEEAAVELGWPCGTVKTRLAKGRALLQERLAGRGVVLPAGAAALLLAAEGAKASMSAALLAATVRLATGAAPVRVAALAEAGVRAGVSLKLHVGLVLLLTGVLAAGLAALAHPERPAPGKQTTQTAPRPEPEADPLPRWAVARLGAPRFRHPGEARLIAFSPDGKMLAAECVGTGLIFWDAAAGKEVRRLPLTTGWSHRLFDFAPRGKLLAVVDSAADAIRCYDAVTGQEVRRLRCPHSLDDSYRALTGGGPSVLRLSPAGNRLAVIALDRAPGLPARVALHIDVLDVGTGKRLQHWPWRGNGNVFSLAFSPDGELLAVAASNPLVEVWNATTGKLAFRVAPSPGDWAPDVAFSPDGKVLAVGTVNRIKLVDVASGKEAAQLPTPRSLVGGLAFTPDGKGLISAGDDPKVRLWDVASRKVRHTFAGPGFHPPCSPLALSPDGKTVALRGPGRTIRLWDVATGRERFPDRKGHDAPVSCVAFSPDGKTLLSGGAGQTWLWDASVWRAQRLLPCTTHAFSQAPDGELLAVEVVDLSSAVAPVVRIRAPMRDRDGARLLLPIHHEILRYAAVPLVAAGDRAVAVLQRNFTSKDEPTRLTVWDATTGRRTRSIALAGQAHALAVSADGRIAALQGNDRAILCDLETGRLRDVMPHQQGRLAISPDGRLFAAVCLALGEQEGGGSIVRVQEVASGKEVFALRGLPRGVGALAFSPGGRLLAAGTGGWGFQKPITHAPEIRVWDLFTGQEVRRLRGQGADSSALCFAPDETRLASGCEDGALLVWDLGVADRQARKGGGLGQRDLERLWADLAGADAGQARQAVARLAAAGKQVVPFLQRRLRPAAVDPGWVKRQIADLDSDHFAVRRRAFEELARRGALVKEALEDALDRGPSAEVRKQAARLLKAADQAPFPTEGPLRALRVLEVLERVGTTEARQALQVLARGVRQAQLTREAKAALERWKTRRPPP